MGKIVGITFPKAEPEKPAEIEPVADGGIEAPAEDTTLKATADAEKPTAPNGKKAKDKAGE